MPDPADIFALVCSSSHRFVVGGESLPLCQRCLGLYVGSLVTLIALIALRARRQGLPRWPVLAVQSALLALALLGGIHVIDGGPTWRFACGLWTGHVATAWMVSASGAMAGLERGTRRQAAALLALIAVLCAMAAASPLVPYAPRVLWVTLALAGMGALAAASLYALARLAVGMASFARRGP